MPDHTVRRHAGSHPKQACGWLRTAGFTGIEVHKRPEIAAAVVWLTGSTPTGR